MNGRIYVEGEQISSPQGLEGPCQLARVLPDGIVLAIGTEQLRVTHASPAASQGDSDDGEEPDDAEWVPARPETSDNGAEANLISQLRQYLDAFSRNPFNGRGLRTVLGLPVLEPGASPIPPPGNAAAHSPAE